MELNLHIITNTINKIYTNNINTINISIILISAVKRLIASKFLFTQYICVCAVYIYYLYINTSMLV